VGSFLRAGPTLHRSPTHSHVRSQPIAMHAPQPLMVGTRPSALPLAPIPLLCSACVATPTKLPPMSRPPVTTLCHKDTRVFAYHLEPSRWLRCIVLSHRHCPPASTVVCAASVIFRSRLLDDEVLEQAALLAKLPLPNACHGCHCLALLVRL
jgi:hypothetical protein